MTIAVVRGANRGIGLALVRALRARGQSVVAAKTLDQTGAEVVPGVDVSKDEGIARLKEAIGHVVLRCW